MNTTLLVIRTGAALHRASQATADPRRWAPDLRTPRRLPTPPPSPPAPGRS